MAQKVPDEPYPKESKQCQEVLLASVNTVQELITQMSSSAGGEQIKPVILYEANLMMQPHLTYIDVHLSDSVHATESSKLHIRALHDCGCAKTVIKTSLFLELTKRSSVKLKCNETPTLIITATGACKEVTGSADVIIHFEGLNGVTMAYPMNILVHPDLTQDLLLGRDFTGSKAKSFETNNRMYLTQSPDKLLGDVLEMIRQKNLCEVPLMSSNSKAKFVSTNEMMIIPTFSTVAATCSLQKSPTQEYHLPFNTAGSTTYEVLNATYPKIETAKMLYFYEDPKQIYIPLFNDTHEEITIAAGTTVAEIELWADNNEHEVHHIRLVGKEFNKFECNNAQMDDIPDFITDDEGMKKKSSKRLL